MNKLKSAFSVYLMFGLMVFGLVANADAQRNQRNNREVNDILRSLNSKIDDFRYDLDSEFRRTSNSRNNTNSQINRNEIDDNLKNLEDSINQFEGKMQRQRETADDVTDILNAARTINDFVKNNRFSGKAAGDWTNARGFLDRLLPLTMFAGTGTTASNYPNNNGNSSNNRYPNDNQYPAPNSYGSNLTGTYQLDTARSENIRDIADRALRNGNVGNNDDARRELENKLEAPAQIAIDAARQSSYAGFVKFQTNHVYGRRQRTHRNAR